MNKQSILKEFFLNEELVEEVFNLYFDDLCRFLGYYTRDRELIEDCLQDIFVKLWEDRATLSIFHIKTYLYKSSRNRMLNVLRSQSSRLLREETWATEEMSRTYAQECVDMEEFAVFYNEAVEALPEKCKMIYQYCKDAHKSYKQVAEELQLSVKTIESQMSIAYRKIKSHIIYKYQLSDPGSLLLLLTVQGAIWAV
ncbi:sigma-70 family RNA polymerase sigma factor [Sphingobacterium tabacisoli]|uniref:Sigma-70 family RNA polymerase sigma factor n=1 Tax=Sphingobacterium tabacisoli TaxID=2044855 RepID=A0ABW5L3F3_9SPHI|nr:sigma-70 family RNA polymerase sigma factor [Sphingobacterium tabacisoli]